MKELIICLAGTAALPGMVQAQCPNICPTNTFLDANPGNSDIFGLAVAIDGDIAACASPYDNHSGLTDPGSVAVLERIGGAWSVTQELISSAPGISDRFGTGLAISGGTIVVGAHLDNTLAGTDAGSVFVFEKIGGTWTETAHLTSPTATPNDEFGVEVDIDGDTIVVGAPFAGADGAGRANVFQRFGPAWTHTIELSAPDGKSGEEFGRSVAIDGDRIVVGAPDHAPDGGPATGAAYPFRRVGISWEPEPCTPKLLASTGAAGDRFGFDVDVSGDTLAVGALEHDPSEGVDAGATYVFEPSGDCWSETTQLVGSSTGPGDNFGSRVALDGDVLAVGAYLHDQTLPSVLANVGAAYVFERSAGAWLERAALAPQVGASEDRFGYGLDVQGDAILVGAHGDNHSGLNDPGSASLWSFSGTDYPSLAHDGTESLSLSAGGTQSMHLNTCIDYSANLYLLAGSTSGTAPGIPLGGACGLTMPLNFDFYTALSVNKPNQGPLVNSLAALDAEGEADAEFTILPGTDPSLAGLTVHHAYGVVEGLGIVFVSEPVSCQLMP